MNQARNPQRSTSGTGFARLGTEEVARRACGASRHWVSGSLHREGRATGEQRTTRAHEGAVRATDMHPVHHRLRKALNVIQRPENAKNTKQTNDQLAIEPPRNVQSTLVQSPLPLKIMGMARLIGKFSTMP
jgi:hypothetical protein